MLREAIISDVPNIRALMQMVPGFWQPWWSEDTIAEAIRSANGLAFVWEQGSQIVGFTCAHNLGFRAYLSELVIDIRVRRQGIGTRLVQAVEKDLRKRGQKILIADVWRDSESFYNSLGWSHPDAVLLRHRLSVEDGTSVTECTG
jgi:ribosomal protein S18 acetylase RimI-like enzyme